MAPSARAVCSAGYPSPLTIHRHFRRPDKALIEAFRGAQTSHLADVMDGRGALDYRIKPLDLVNASLVGLATERPRRPR